jgi:hypothetical protein
MGHFELRARNLRPLRGKLVSTYVDGKTLVTRTVGDGGSLRVSVAGSGLVDGYRIHVGTKVILRGPRGQIVAHGRLRDRSG